MSLENVEIETKDVEVINTLTGQSPFILKVNVGYTLKDFAENHLEDSSKANLQLNGSIVKSESWEGYDIPNNAQLVILPSKIASGC